MPFKPGIKIDKLKPQMALAHVEVRSIYESYGFPCIITSGNDGEHSENSKHYTGEALDYRTRVIKAQDVRVRIRDDVFETLNGFPYEERFSPENAPHKLFDVVLHSTHLHVEYDPANG